MLIKKLELENFRQYIGSQTIEFSIDREKNVTVLIVRPPWFVRLNGCFMAQMNLTTRIF